MTQNDIEKAVQQRLDALATQVALLCKEGDTETATFVRNKGLELAQAYDSGYEFFFLGDQRLRG